MSTDPQSRSIAELTRQFTEQTTRLAQKEVDLAKAELALKGRQVGTGVGAFGGAGLVAALSLGALVATVILMLATAMTAWLAALIVTVVLAAFAGALALMGKAKVRQASPPTPEQTIETVKEDVREAKNRAQEGRA
ncbi:MAG TPA: phage holin family protein [Solirubrobacterales bacterium]|jgi:membrane protein